MRLYGDTRSRTWVKIAAAVAASGTAPVVNTMKAFGTDRRSGSGLGTTAASATAGCSMSTLSSSKGLMR